MVVIPRYSHHRHTGRLRPHHETSYGLLVFLMLLAGMVLAGITATTNAATEGTGKYTVEAVVPGPRPNSPVIITSPVNGQVFQTNPIQVSGTCPAKSLVKIFKNGVLAGSVICAANGRFSLPIDLVVGANSLTGLAYNALDQEGPSSPAVNVTLTLPPGGFGFSTELIIQSTNYYRGTEPGQEVIWPIEIVGGQAPYAVSIDWGDGTSDLITRLAPGPFTVKHIYKKVGTGYLGSYPLIIRATDAVGHTAYLQLTTLVNEATAGTSAAKTKPRNELMIAWPLWGGLILAVVSFWLGELREKHVMERRMEEGVA